jgi:Uma2 family endonuclease
MSVLTYLPGISTERAAVPPGPVWRISVEQYHDMIRAGILTENDPVELLDGWLVPKMTKNPPHCLVTESVREVVGHVLPAGWHARSQNPITLSTSEPEPDAVVARGDRSRYRDHHPGPPDLAMVIEVADATLECDRIFKKSLYAQAGIPVYWIVNLVERRVELYSDPPGPAPQPDYRGRRDYSPAEELPLVIEGQEVARLPVASLLP